MTWPPKSPDLNPIKLVWDEQKDSGVKAKQPASGVMEWIYSISCPWYKEYLLEEDTLMIQRYEQKS